MNAPTLEDAREAARRIEAVCRRTPVLELPDDHGETVCALKLETLQHTGSFKMRGAANAAGALDGPIYTLSAGNMAAAVARAGKLAGLPTAVVVPDTAPAAKRAAVERWGGEITAVPYEDWWQAVIGDGWAPLHDHAFIHPFADPLVMAGNATIALELVEQVPDLQEILCPYGGGGLICGIASAIKALKPDTRIVVTEVETAAPLTGAFAAGEPVTVDYRASFVDGCGSRSVAAAMWPLASALVDDTEVVTLAEVAGAIRMLAERCHVIAEGAGAVAVAAALKRGGGPDTVAIVSGGNLDTTALTTILAGGVP